MLEKLAGYLKRAESLEYNSQEFTNWCEYNSNHKAQGSTIEYANGVILFLEYYKKFIGNINSNDILNFREHMISKGNGVNNRKKHQSAIRDFIIYVNNNFNYSIDLGVLPETEKEDKTSIDENDSFLSMDEYIELKNNLFHDNNYRWLFYLEMTYRHGFKLEQLVQCTKENYSEQTNCFTIDGKSYLIEKDLADYIKLDKNILKKVIRTTYQDHFKRMSGVINKDISWQVIANTRDKFSILCPCCNNPTINDGDYWVVGINNNDLFNKKWLICKSCAVKKDGASE